MDRFIDMKTIRALILITILKSNMDRFIGSQQYTYPDTIRLLKSNMDRFIADGLVDIILQAFFKIQYG